MAHRRLLFVGGRNNLKKIFDNTPDSSTESAAEMAFGFDWIDDYDRLSEEEKTNGWTTDNFTKDNKELYQDIIKGRWSYCFDVRNPNRYGGFDWLNCPDFEPYDENNNCFDIKDYDEDWGEKVNRNNIRIIEAIKQLPTDTLFHFAECHFKDKEDIIKVGDIVIFKKNSFAEEDGICKNLYGALGLVAKKDYGLGKYLYSCIYDKKGHTVSVTKESFKKIDESKTEDLCLNLTSYFSEEDIKKYRGDKDDKTIKTKPFSR